MAQIHIHKSTSTQTYTCNRLRTSELALERGQHKRDGLGGASRRGDDVLISGARIAHALANEA